MDTLRLRPREPVVEALESWDDDDFQLIEETDLSIQSQSTSATLAPLAPHRRDSHSSFRSDFDSILGDEEKQVVLPGDDEKSTLDAIEAATKAGIPIPKNVPPSALMGGTIKRLGGRKIKKAIIEEDWVDDLEFPEPGQSLQLKLQDGSNFPDVLRQVSSSVRPSPSKLSKPASPTIPEEPEPQLALLPASVNLDRFRDTDEDDDFFGDGTATIKVSKRRQVPKPVSMITPPTPKPKLTTDDDFETDLVLPSDGKLKLSNRRDIPKTPSLQTLDDLEWAEGSLGTRFGGTRREGRVSNRSSSVSAFSPSISSSVTAESEDEALDGLVLPDEPINFGERLKSRRRVSRSPRRSSPPRPAPEPAKKSPSDDEDFLTGLDFGDGDVLGNKKMTLHRNVQVKETRPPSPSRPKTAVALKFTSKPMASSRLPRPMGPMASHERSQTHPTLEPVPEAGGTISRSRRSMSRMGHSAQSSVASVPTPTCIPPAHALLPPTPHRRELAQKASTVSLRNEPTTTSAQLLRLKRSLPAMRGMPQSPAKPPMPQPAAASRTYERPPSRAGMSMRSQGSFRPRTPVERMRAGEPFTQTRKSSITGISSAQQPQSASARNPRALRRLDSDASLDLRPSSRAVSRTAMRSPSPRKHRPAEKAAPEGPYHQINRPRRVRHFGDGHELDGFDDLPTSTQAEARFLRQSVTNGPKTLMRNRMYQNVLPERTPSPMTPFTPRTDHVPSFARDTAASRHAREAVLAQRTTTASPPTTQRVAQLATKSNLNPNAPPANTRLKRMKKTPQLKPHLIANLNPPKESKLVNGMFYNPDTFRWEGNDNVLTAFDVPVSSPSATSLAQFQRDRENMTPRPALITNIGATKGVQVVGGMVFDPQNMCWIKMAPGRGDHRDDIMDGFNAMDSEEDVFKDIPDLEDRTANSSEDGHGDVKDDWLVGEEFDVGPEFVRRLREEESRWKKKVGPWFPNTRNSGHTSPFDARDDMAWRWAIRDIVNSI